MVQSKAIKKRKTKNVARKKKAVKKKPAKKKAPIVRRYVPQYISGDHMSDYDLNRFVSSIRKVRRYKRTRYQRKTGLTNVVSLLNLLYNSEREKRRRPTRNLMYTHPYNYRSLIPDANVDSIWKSTGIRSARTRNRIISNINDVYHSLYGHQLIKAPGTSNPFMAPPPTVQAPKIQPQPIPSAPLEPLELPVKPSKAPPMSKPPRALPVKPSAPPPPPHNNDSDLDSSSSDEEEGLM